MIRRGKSGSDQTIGQPTAAAPGEYIWRTAIEMNKPKASDATAMASGLRPSRHRIPRPAADATTIVTEIASSGIERRSQTAINSRAAA